MTSAAGSDWNTIMVKDLETGNVLSDTLRWVKFSGAAWQGDGFYYSRYPEPKSQSQLSAKNEYHSVYFHKLGTDQKADKLIYTDKKFPLRNAYASLTEDERFLIISGSESTSGNSLAIQDMNKPSSKFNWIIPGFKDDFQVIGIQGISTVSEAGLGDLELVKAFIKQHQIPTIFVENSVSHATIERVAKDLGVAIGRELFSDALGVPQMHETINGETYDLGTYEGMVQHNVNVLVEGLAKNP